MRPHEPGEDSPGRNRSSFHVVAHERVALPRDVIFEPSDLGIRAADGHRDELASVHNRPQQRLDLQGNNGPVVRHDDPFAARSRQAPGAV